MIRIMYPSKHVGKDRLDGKVTNYLTMLAIDGPTRTRSPSFKVTSTPASPVSLSFTKVLSLEPTSCVARALPTHG